MIKMPKITIKKEKEDTAYSDERTEATNNQARIVSLKSTKSTTSTLKGKINVKTLREIKEEKKKVIGTHASYSGNHVSNNVSKNFALRSLSVPVPLICLPNGHPGKRTFRVSSLPSNVKIKKEPVEDNEYSDQFNSSIDYSTVRVKQEKHDNFDYEYKYGPNTNDMNAGCNPRDKTTLMSDHMNSDTSSEENSFDNLSCNPIVDFSDIPRCVTQDEDSMSLFAEETFEEENDADDLTRQSGDVRMASESQDLRLTLEQNRNGPVLNSEVNRASKKANKREKRNNRQKNKLTIPIIHQGNNLHEIQHQNELERAKMLHSVVCEYNIKRGVIPQKSIPLVDNVNDTSHNMNLSGSDIRPKSLLVTAEELKRRPEVPGGRGFFEDAKPQTTDINGQFNDKSKSWVIGDYTSKKKNQTNKFKTLKRRSAEDERSSGSECEAKAKRREPHHKKSPKQLYCNTQMLLGKCDFSFCKFKHMAESELEEYKRTGVIKVKEHLQQEKLETERDTASHDVQTSDDVSSSEANEDDGEQMYKGLSVAANQAMDSLKLNEALQIILYMYEAVPSKHQIVIPLVERLLVLCGQEHTDLHSAAQVSAQAFDLIPKVRGDYNRHDFTNFIRCLCHTGQYIRAYEALDEMRSLNLNPTHDVFLDLINSSHDHPLRAFDLLDEIKSLGLFRSSICSALILLSCKARVPLVGRTWALFKEMMDESVKPSKQSFLAMLDLLADNYEVDKLLQAIVLYDDNTVVPSEKCNKLVVKHSKDNSDLVSQCVDSLSEMHQPQLDVETWNILLSNCYSETFNLAIKAEKVHKLMKKFNIPFLPLGYNGLLCCLSGANLTITVMEVIKDAISHNFNFAECKQGMIAAVNALMRTKQLEDLVHVIPILLAHGIMVEEKPLLAVLQVLETRQSYEKMHQIFKKCEEAKLTMSVACFRKIYLTLEKWVQNPAASLDVYAAMKLAYPIIPESTSEVSENRKHGGSKRTVCKYFMNNRCKLGSKCRFLHVTPSAEEGGSNYQKEQSNPFVLRSANIPNQSVLPAPPLPPPLPPPFSFSMNPLMTVGSFPPVSDASALWKVPGFQPPNTDLSPPNPPAPSPPTVPNHSSMKQKATTSCDEPNPINLKSERLKSELRLYEGKIETARQEQNFEELARIYVEMKSDKIPVCNEMLELFYSSFTSFSNIGESLLSFVAIIDIQLDNPDSDEVESRESLDSEDQKFIGELSVALMQLCRNQKRLDEGYLVLHVLHQYNINYFQYPASFVPNEQVLSSSSIALLAADMCLCLEKDPQFDGAVEVLRGCNYALPQEGSCLSTEEAGKRRDTIQKIIAHYLSAKEYDVVYEFLNNIGDSGTIGMTNLRTLYNQLLKGYIDDEKVEDAIRVIREMESELISRDTHVLRSLVTCLGKIGRFMQSKEIFRSSCLQGAYPPFSLGNDLWQCKIWSSFSKFEVQFYLEQHLQLLNKHVEQQRAASQMPYDEKHLKKLRIIISNEEPLFVTNLGAISEMQESVIEILASEFNPPLSCGISDVIGEVVVNPPSLKRWFIANPSPENQRSSTYSNSSERHLRNVSASAGNISIRVDLKKENSGGQTKLDKEVTEKIKHTICGHLTRYVSNGVISNKDCKTYARVICEDYFKQNSDVYLDYDKQQRIKVITFVEKYFDRRIAHS